MSRDNPMKITIELPDPLFQQARQYAQAQHITMKTLIEQGLRRIMAEQKETTPSSCAMAVWAEMACYRSFRARRGTKSVISSTIPSKGGVDDCAGHQPPGVRASRGQSLSCRDRARGRQNAISAVSPLCAPATRWCDARAKTSRLAATNRLRCPTKAPSSPNFCPNSLACKNPFIQAKPTRRRHQEHLPDRQAE